jgi:predicted dithiol-disulfide oxidoreductase (DUF899 family)
MTTTHTVGTREEWLQARRALLAREKELTRLNDELTEQRRALPWVPVEKEYVFDTDDGPRTLAQLFDGRPQLLVYHFMFGPDWSAGCPGCSMLADEVDGGIVHLENNGATMIFASRAPLDMIQAYKARMGWSVRWVSAFGTDFNADYGVSFTDEQRAAGAEYNFRHTTSLNDELPGLSVFALDDEGAVHHTYSMYARGMEVVDNLYALMDRTPIGRNEQGGMRDWLRRRDEYGSGAAPTWR